MDSASLVVDNPLGSPRPLVKVPPKEWTVPVEDQFAKWGDVAACYIWMHDRARRRAQKFQYLYNIPVIVLSTLTGTVNFGIGSVVPEGFDQKYVQIGIGMVSIFIGILGTLSSYFRYAEKAEGHLNALQGWSKLYRNICQEVNIERVVRHPANDFYKLCKAEYDRLMETSPILPSQIIQKFRNDVHVVPDVKLPQEVLDHIDHTPIHIESEDDLKKIVDRVISGNHS